MKTSSLTLDKTLYQILVEEAVTNFTVPELRDRYAETLSGKHFELRKLRIYVYEQVRKMINAGWVRPDEERKKRGQLFHLLKKPKGLEVKLAERGFPFQQAVTDSIDGRENTNQQIESTTSTPDGEAAVSGDVDKLQGMLKEVRVDFLTQVGQTERFRELMNEMPSLKSLLELEFFAARDSSSRLLGHVRALEVALQKLEH